MVSTTPEALFPRGVISAGRVSRERRAGETGRTEMDWQRLTGPCRHPKHVLIGTRPHQQLKHCRYRDLATSQTVPALKNTETRRHWPETRCAESLLVEIGGLAKRTKERGQTSRVQQPFCFHVLLLGLPIQAQ